MRDLGHANIILKPLHRFATAASSTAGCKGFHD